MRTIALTSAVNPLQFGRRRRQAALNAIAVPRQAFISEDVRLFLWTFAAGFLSVSIYLA
jgi:hypothetical protein